ncbi:MAG TPA: hypothetical protein VIK18_04945 [Pirellulales bacterium]
MHTVELLDEALALAGRLGYKVRRDWLGGEGGVCQIRAQKWIFLDQTGTPAEHLQLALEALQAEPASSRRALSPGLARLLNVRQAA